MRDPSIATIGPLGRSTRLFSAVKSNAHLNAYSRRLTTAALLPLLLWVGLLLYPQAAASQRQGRPAFSPEVETRFQRALDRYTKGEFAQARAEFQALLDLSLMHQRSSASALMLAKTLYKLHEYDLAIAAVAQLYEGFSQSRYLPEGDLVAGDCKFRKGETDAAADNYVKVLKGEGDMRLKARAADRLGEMVVAKRLSTAQIQRLKGDLTPDRFDEVVQFGRVRWTFRLGRSDAGASQAVTFLKTFPSSPFAGEAQALIRTTSAPAAAPPVPPLPADRQGRLKVAVLCPISRDLGKELRDGILLARDTMPPATGDSLDLVFEDSNDDPITSVKMVQKLVLDREVVAIVGDLTSRSTVPAAAVANASQVPLITPTASEDGIASIGTYIFQVNTTPGAQGRKVAEYAFRAGLRTFAILASLDAYGRRMAEAFAGRIQALGGKVVIQEWYSPGTTDFQNQVRRIHEVGAALAGTVAVGEPPDTSAAGADTVQVVTSIDGLLVAAQTPEDVILTVSQIAAHHIVTHLLGGDGWNSPSVSREVGGVVQNALFVSKYFEDPADTTARKFREAFRARFGRAPNVASALGYDAMTCILRAVAAGGTTREALRERLAAGQDFSGATGRVLLAPGERENSGMYILTIRDGRITPADVEGQ